VPVCYLASSVVVVVEDRPPFGEFGCALRHRPAGACPPESFYFSLWRVQSFIYSGK